VNYPAPEAGIEPAAFDYERAAPVLLEWLPRVEDQVLREVIARSLGFSSAPPGTAKALVAEFRRQHTSDDWMSTKWAVGSAISEVRDPSVADDVIELLRDRRHGGARQMLCEALRRMKDPRAPGVFLELLDDPDVAGHAILELRMLGPKRSLPHLEKARPTLERLAKDAAASPFTRRQARKALERIA
jgi:HEAT repeat protein